MGQAPGPPAQQSQKLTGCGDHTAPSCPSTQGPHSRPQKAQGQQPLLLAWPHPQWAVEGSDPTTQQATALGEPDTWAPSSRVKVREEHILLVLCHAGRPTCQSPTTWADSRGQRSCQCQHTEGLREGGEAAGPAKCSWESCRKPTGRCLVWALPVQVSPWWLLA